MQNACLAYLDEKHECPHCHQDLTCCSAPPIHVGDGLGWGSEVMFICLNDDCPLFVRGWQHIEQQFGHSASYRYMQIPGEKSGTAMMVASNQAFKGCVLDPESIKLQNDRYRREKEAVAQLDTCVEEKNLEPVLILLLDEAAHIDNRKRACELLTKVNDLACIDSLRNHTFRDESFAHQVNMAIETLLKANYRKECPYCAELIKAQARLCQHCGKDLA